MARFIRRPGRGLHGSEPTATGVVVRPPIGEAGMVPHGAEIAGYRIGPQLGRGGMGVVYKAHHVRLDRPAALKVLSPELAAGDEFRERFMRESQVAAALQHPNVVAVYDAGEEDDLLYLAMQYVAGVDLRRLLDLEGPLDAERTVGILAQVASALDEAHSSGLVHRDVKPGNILLDVDRAYLGDFGLTKRYDASGGLTGVNNLIGTVDYLAPEQIEGARVDGRADQYALACVAYECLADRPPHDKDSDIAVIFAHVKEEPLPLSRLRDDIPADADEVMARALAKQPANRFASCREFAFELARELDVDPPLGAIQEATARVIVASDDASTRAIVRGSLSCMGVAVSEVLSDELPPWLGDRRFDMIITDSAFDSGALTAIREALESGGRSPDPRLLVLVPRGAGGPSPAAAVPG
jgi:serine/threonine protein kinase